MVNHNNNFFGNGEILESIDFGKTFNQTISR